MKTYINFIHIWLPANPLTYLDAITRDDMIIIFILDILTSRITSRTVTVYTWGWFWFFCSFWFFCGFCVFSGFWWISYRWVTSITLEGTSFSLRLVNTLKKCNISKNTVNKVKVAKYKLYLCIIGITVPLTILT